jgi:hypothetical protein
MATEFRASLLMADYLAVDVVGKITAVGLSWTIAGLDVNTGMTPPMSVGIIIDVPPDRLGKQFPVGLDLRNSSGVVVQVPGVSGALDALRVQQLMKAERPQLGVYLPETVGGRVQSLIAFASGIPLASGQSYHWHLEVDHQHSKAWEAHFHIAGPPPGPVLGGPVGPADIPNIVMPDESSDEPLQ